MDETVLHTIKLDTLLPNAPAQKRRATLVPVDGSGERRFDIDQPQILVGRGDEAQLRLQHPSVSRKHARLLAVHNMFYVNDLDSTNGTYINGQKVRFERLAPSDIVQFGHDAYRFVLGPDTDDEYLQKLNLDTVTSLALAVEAKDPYTKGHSERVGSFSEKLAQAVGLDSAAAERARIAGVLHDIGKIGVPEKVLLKKGRLNDAEYAEIRKHPVAGENILMPLEFLQDILPAVRYHHERFDGRGYPDGLGGEDLPLTARIIQVVDTYDAMTSNRPYRDALELQPVIEEFRRCAGSQFDPRVAEAFLDILPQFF